MDASRTLKLWMAVIIVVLTTGACGKGKGHTSATPTTSTSPSASSAAPTTGTRAGSATTATSAPIPAGTSTTPAASTAPPPCPTSQLAVTLAPGNGTAGSIYFMLNFRNQGASTCHLDGYPGVSYVTGSAGTQVGNPATRVAAPGNGITEQAFDVAPGDSAHATLREIDVGNYPSAICDPTPVLGLRVYPPNQTAAAFVPQTSTGCGRPGPEQLQISFVVPGVG